MKTPALHPWVKWGLLLFIVSLRLWGVWQRSELHADEVYSLMICQANKHFDTPIPDGTYTGADLQALLAKESGLSDDLKALYTDNHDSPHASLYYMLLRCPLGGYTEWDPVALARIGGCLNLLLLIGTYLILWQLASRLTARRSVWVVAATVGAALLTPGAGECAVLVREYQLAMLFVAWWALQAVALLRVRPRRATRTLIGAGLAAAGLLSTGYLNAYFLILLPLCLWLFAANKGERLPYFARITTACLCGLLLAWALYGGYFNFILHPSVHTRRAFTDFGASLYCAFWRDAVQEGVQWPCLLMLLACVIESLQALSAPGAPRRHFGISLKGVKTFRRNASLCGAITFAALAAIFLVQWTSLLREPRYSYPYLPMLAMLVPLCTDALPRKARTWWAAAFLLFFLVIGTCTARPKEYGWEYVRTQLKDGAVMTRLHPNEHPLLWPCLSPSAFYRIESPDTVHYDPALPTVTDFKPRRPPEGARVQKLKGPLYITIPAR